jgi:hypothetical protein
MYPKIVLLCEHLPMTRKRTVGEQVASGFRIAGSMVLAFTFIVALIGSTFFLLGLNNAEAQGQHRILGGTALVGLSVLLFLTTRHWAKWLVGIVAYCFAKVLIGTPFFLLSGKTNVAKQLVFVLIYCLIAALLTWRHFEREPTGIEKVGLVGFVVCASFAMALQSYLPLLVGLALLAIGELAQRILQPRRTRVGGHCDSPLSIV